ncbi:hypothetical protein ACQPZZ_14040 [Microbispora sp. CA-135349]|uniref:hypothetical protein n=1 Tax=Microbispora sp. CA-135349 TaxID=3239953 RepID=UPI003D94AB17
MRTDEITSATRASDRRDQDTGPGPGTVTRVPNRVWSALMLAGWAGQVAIRVWSTWRQAMPSLTPDETGYLIGARVLAGGTSADLSGNGLYRAGYSLLISPVYWLTDDPHLVYRLVVLLNCLISSAVFPLAYALSRRLSLPRAAAGALAFACALLPAVVYYVQFAMADAVLPVVVLGWLLLTHRWISDGRLRYGIAAGALASYAYAVHSRGTVILLVHAGLLGVVLLRRGATRRDVAVAAQVMATTAALAWAINHWLQSRVYPGGILSMSDYLVDRLTSVDGLVWTLSLTAGQVWYLITATWGLAGLGLLALTSTVISRTAPPAIRTMAAIVLAVVLGVALGSSAALPDEHSVNNFFYGRYLACVAPVLFAIGAAVLHLRRTRLPRAFAATAAGAMLCGGIASLYAGERLTAYPYLKFNFPEISALTRQWSSLHVGQATAGAILLLALVIAITATTGRESTILTATALAFLNFAAVIVVTLNISWPMAASTRAAADLTDAGISSDDRIAIDRNGVNFRIWMLHAFQAPWHPITPMRPTDPTSLPSETTLVIVPRSPGTSERSSWPAAPAAWHPVLARDSWVAWRPASR